MARARMIKPEFYTDETLSECSVSARYLFIAMWVFADDYGNIEASHAQMKMRVFPADSINVSPIVAELEKAGLVTRYAEKFLHINNFLKHQIINRPSKPRCPKYEDSLITHGALSEPSVSTLPEVEVELEYKPCAISIALRYDFNIFWDAFAYKVSRARAERAWKKIKMTQELFDTIIASAQREASNRPSLIAKNKTPKMAEGWLNDKRWEDEATTVDAGPSKEELFAMQYGRC